MSKPSASSPEWVDPRPMLPPAPECARCGRPIEETGGRRIHLDEEAIVPELVFWENQFRAWRFSNLNWSPLDRFPPSVRPFIRGQVAENLRRELRSWMCQYCAEELCRTCGWPLRYPRTQPLVTDSGGLRRGPWKGQWYGCVNPACACHHLRPDKERNTEGR